MRLLAWFQGSHPQKVCQPVLFLPLWWFSLSTQAPENNTNVNFSFLQQSQKKKDKETLKHTHTHKNKKQKHIHTHTQEQQMLEVEQSTFFILTQGFFIAIYLTF